MWHTTFPTALIPFSPSIIMCRFLGTSGRPSSLPLPPDSVRPWLMYIYLFTTPAHIMCTRCASSFREIRYGTLGPSPNGLKPLTHTGALVCCNLCWLLLLPASPTYVPVPPTVHEIKVHQNQFTSGARCRFLGSTSSGGSSRLGMLSVGLGR